MAKYDPQQRAVKVLVELLKSHQGLLGLVKSSLPPHTPVNLKQADSAFAAAGLLLNDIRLGELRVTRWALPEKLICVECGYIGDGDASLGCPDCGGQFAEN